VSHGPSSTFSLTPRGVGFVAREKQAEIDCPAIRSASISAGESWINVSIPHQEEGASVPIAIESRSRSASSHVRCEDNGSQPEQHHFFKERALSHSSGYTYETASSRLFPVKPSDLAHGQWM
jgi:hypothetical protein